MSSKAPTQTVKATSVIKKKTKEEQLLEALEQARAEGAEAAELASVDTSNLLAQAPAAVASDAAATSTAATSTAGTTTAATTATAAGGAAAVSTGVVVAGVAGATVVAVAASNSSSSSNDTPKDTTAPTATITLSDSALKKGETATVTVTFSEAVTGFSNADLTLTSGELSDMSSSDGGKTWTGTFTPTDDLEDATNVISLANTYTDLAGNAGTTASSANYSVDTKTPLIQSLSANGVDKTVTLTYSETLDATNIPATTAFTIQVNGADNAVTQVVANGATLVLTLANPFITGQTVSVTYTDAVGDGSTTIQDAAGNDAVSFSSGIVADGYIRDAQIYIDTNNNGVADSSEKLEGVVTDANGNFFLPSTAPGGTIIAVGGVNIDTGLPNATPMKAPAGSTTINPLTTLVQAVVEQAAASGQTLSATDAATNVATALGLTLPEGKTLNNYDPLSATDEGALAAQIAAAQIATLTTLAAEAAGSSDAQTAATSVLTNIANVVANNASVGDSNQKVSLSDTSVLTQALSGVTVTEEQQAAIVEANTAIAAAKNITAISTAQSQFVDKIAPDAPTVISIAALTNDTTPAVEVTLNTKTTDGKAAVAGDTLVILDGNNEVATVVITVAHLAAGKVAIDLPTLSEGSHTLTAKLTDKAGNASGISNASTVVVDNTGPSVAISSSTDNLAAGASTTLTLTFSEAVTGFTATDLQVTGGGTITNLVKDSDTVYTATYTAPTTGGAGSVYIAQGSYTDAAGNTGTGSNTLNLAAVNLPVLSINTIGGADKVISGQTGDNLITGTAQASNGDVTLKYGTTTLGTATVATNGTWSYSLTTDNLTAIDEGGAKSITAEQTRTVSDTPYTGSASVNFSVDTNAPSTTLSMSGISGHDTTINIADKATGVIVSGTAETGSTVQLTVGTTVKTLSTTDGAWSYTLTLADYKALSAMSTPSVSAIAIDGAGNKSQAVTQPFSIDTTAPTMGLVSLTNDTDTGTKGDGRTSNTAPSISLAGFTAEQGSTLSIAIDEGNFSTATLTESGVVLPTLSDGVHSIKVKATDAAGNESIRTTSIVIDTTVPTITSAATMSVLENSGASKVVYTATSTDASVVSYALKQGLQDNAGHFTIDSKTGKVTLKDNPNYEDIPSYSFTIVATDAAGNASEKAVTLSITDVNEAPTAVTIANGTIAENTPISTALKVADIAITDDALGTNSITLTGADAANFEVMGNALYLKADTSLNFEAKAKYDVTVNVADSSVTGSTPVTANYSLTVTDVNEAPTAVAVTNATLSIAENTPITNPMKVADIAITDDALGTNSITLSGADAANFEVIGNALYLKAGTNLNFEAQNKLDVTVNVADASLTGSTPVTANYSLAVTNVNEAPVASKNYQSTERIVNGQALTDFTFVPDFVDPEGDNLSFTYSGTLPVGLTFTNGVVSGTPTTDGNYTFTVTASDGSLTHSQDYTVSVVSAPVVQSMTITDTEGETSTGKQGDTLLIDLKLSEAVTLNQGEGAFTITLSGAQTPFTASFVRLSDDKTTLTFSGTAPSGNTSALELASLNLNGTTITGNTTNVALEYTRVVANYTLDNTPPADAVISVGGADSVLNATEATNATSISITPDTGATVSSVTLNTQTITAQSNGAYVFDAIQLEQNTENSVTVVTVDAAGNSKTTTKTFTVDTIAPTFQSGATANAIVENTGANQIVYQAMSNDSGAKYSLKAGSDTGLSIDANTGEVKLLANPNYEAKSSYSFTVVATDTAGNFSEQALTLAITNANDAPTGGVTISGVPTIGATLTAYNTLADEDGITAAGISYQWYANGAGIEGATGNTFELTNTYLGQNISVAAIYTDGLDNTTRVVSNPTAPVADLVSLPGGLQVTPTGSYQYTDYYYGAVTFNTNTETTWTPAEGETVIGLTSHYVTTPSYYNYKDIVVQNTTGDYSIYSFLANSNTLTLESATPTPLTSAQVASLAITWNADLLGSGLLVQSETPIVQDGTGGTAIYAYTNETVTVYALVSAMSTSSYVIVAQNADGSLWLPAQDTTPKALAYNPINGTMNLYYTENGVAKFVTFSQKDQVATAGTVNTMGTKGIETAESFTGVDINGDGKIESVTIANKWAIPNYNSNTYLVKTTDANGKSIFGLVQDNPLDDISLSKDTQLQSFMKLFKTNDDSTAWTPGSTDLSVKAIQPVYAASGTSTSSTLTGFEVLIQSKTGAFTMWTFGTDGNATTTTAQDVSNAKLYAFEQAAQQDINADGMIGTTNSVNITTGNIIATLQNAGNFTTSTGWKLGSETNVSFTSSTAGNVTFPDGQGGTTTVPFTLSNGAIVFTLPDSSTASYKLLANNANMIVLASTTSDVTAAMNIDQNGPAPIMTIYKDSLGTAQTLPTTSATLYTTTAANFGDWHNPVSVTLDPATRKMTYTDIWGITTSMPFSVSNNVITANMSSIYSTQSFNLSVMASANDYYLIKSEYISSYQQATTTLTDIKVWFMSASGMNNTYPVYDNTGVSTQVTINWNGNTASYTANGQTYTVTYDANANSIKFQSSPDYYEAYTLSGGTVSHTYTSVHIETWSASPVFDYTFVPDTPPVITIDADAKTATVTNIEEGTQWQYQINGYNDAYWVDGPENGVIDLSGQTGYMYINVRQSDSNGSYVSGNSESAYASYDFRSSTTTSSATEYLYSTPVDGTFDLAPNTSSTINLGGTAAQNGLDQIKGFTFGDTNDFTYGLGDGDRINLTAFLGSGYKVADADTNTTGIQAFTSNSTAGANIANKIAVVSDVIDALNAGNGIADDLAALFGDGKPFASLSDGSKTAVLATGADNVSASLWYVTGTTTGATAEQVANMTNIGNLSSVIEANLIPLYYY